VNDSCGVCGGFDECLATCVEGYDSCGVCGGSNLCRGCDNISYSGLVFDQCGVCNGTNACIGCDGILHLTGQVPRFDACGVCNGTNTTCLGCDGILYPEGGPPAVDLCGVCGGNNGCLCDIEHLDYVVDRCFQCLAPNDTRFDSCVGCDNVTFSGKTIDRCGTCSLGENLCLNPSCDEPFEVPDACGLCGGDNSTCDFDQDRNVSILQPLEPADQLGTVSQTEAAVIGVSIAVPLVALIGVLAVLAFFLYKQKKNPYWSVSQAELAVFSDGVTINPLFQERGGFHVNPLADLSAGAPSGGGS